MKSGKSLLHLAAEKGKIDLLNKLLNHSIDVNSRTFSGYTPLQSALGRGYLEIAKILKESKAVINEISTDSEEDSDIVSKNKKNKGKQYIFLYKYYKINNIYIFSSYLLSFSKQDTIDEEMNDLSISN